MQCMCMSDSVCLAALLGYALLSQSVFDSPSIRPWMKTVFCKVSMYAVHTNAAFRYRPWNTCRLRLYPVCSSKQTSLSRIAAPGVCSHFPLSAIWPCSNHFVSKTTSFDHAISARPCCVCSLCVLSYKYGWLLLSSSEDGSNDVGFACQERVQNADLM